VKNAEKGFLKMKKICTLVVFSILFAVAYAADKGDSSSGTLDQKPSGINVNDLIVTDRSETFVSQGSLVLSGEQPVSVGTNGAIKLVAGQSIILLPGTKISSGGFLYATIQNPKGKHSGKVTKLVTIEEKEKIDEQKALEHATTLLSPFPTKSLTGVSPDSNDSKSIAASSIHQSGITSGNNNKINAVTDTKLVISQTFSNYDHSRGFTIADFVPPTRFVLRL
jgi:hypothetical protein